MKDRGQSAKRAALSVSCEHVAVCTTAMARLDTSSTTTAEPALTVIVSVVISLIAYKMTAVLVPLLGPDLLAKGLGGRDMLKKGYKRKEDASEDRETVQLSVCDMPSSAKGNELISISHARIQT